MTVVEYLKAARITNEKEIALKEQWFLYSNLFFTFVLEKGKGDRYQ